MKLRINGRPFDVADQLADEPLLWVLRERLGLVGTRFGCGIGACGACTVHVDGAAERSCLRTCASVVGSEVTTIEGLRRAGALHPVQEAWIAEAVPQCGYCQSGQIMSAAALLASNPDPRETDIDAAMARNLCRCGTYDRIKRAIGRAARALRGEADGAR